VCYVGLRIRIPGIQPDWLTRGIWDTNDSALLKFFDTITGHGLSRGSILALSITPFLTARGYMWLAKKVFPRVAAMDEGDAGRARLKKWTRSLNLVVALTQSFGYAKFLQTVPNVVVSPGPGFILGTMALLTAGAVVMMHLSERVTDDDGAIARDNAAQKPLVDGVPAPAALNPAQSIDESFQRPGVFMADKANVPK
ncbi:MAG: hypothetical protein ABI120_16235, partial [Gemmatimonadaceae bacterium]